MKYFPSRILFLVIISLAFCKEDEKYTFYYGKHTENIIYEHNYEQEVSFNVPGIGLIQYASTYTSLDEYLGKEGGFHKFKVTMKDMKINAALIFAVILQAIGLVW